MTDLLVLHRDLEAYSRMWPQDRPQERERYLQFVRSTDQCCERSHLAGHCTGSAWVVSPDLEQVLLLFHPYLKRWLQPGGHADGNPDLLDVARREAHEESGLDWESLTPAELQPGLRVPFDLDIHAIPARGDEPDHFHYDMRYLLIADPALPLKPERPDMPLQWLKMSEVTDRTDEESVLRMVRKTVDSVEFFPTSTIR